MLDLLSDILTRLSLHGTLYFRTSFTEPWGVRVPAFRDVRDSTSPTAARRWSGSRGCRCLYTWRRAT